MRSRMPATMTIPSFMRVGSPFIRKRPSVNVHDSFPNDTSVELEAVDDEVVKCCKV